ncbi:MAG: DUF2726 domain-containing protein [Phycisphaerales bacterium]
MLKLAVVLVGMLVVVGVICFIALVLSKKIEGDTLLSGGERLDYRRRDWLLTKAERSFLAALDAAVSGGHGLDGVRVMCKVRLADLVYLPKGMDRSSRARQQNRVNQKHVDFVLVSTDELRPLVVIELDDSSHEREDRRARDGFVDRALGAAGLPLVRVAAARGYVPGELAGRVRGAMKT